MTPHPEKSSFGILPDVGPLLRRRLAANICSFPDTEPWTDVSFVAIEIVGRTFSRLRCYLVVERGNDSLSSSYLARVGGVRPAYSC